MLILIRTYIPNAKQETFRLIHENNNANIRLTVNSLFAIKLMSNSLKVINSS